MQSVKTLASRVITLLIFSAVVISCKKETDRHILISEDIMPRGKQPVEPGFTDNDMVLYWHEKAGNIIAGPSTPPAAARFYAMIQISVHDALNSIKPKYQRFALTDEREQFASPAAAIASAAYWTIKGLGIQGTNPIDDWYNESLASIDDGDNKTLGKMLGKKAADAILTNRSTDNFLQANQQLPVPDGIHPGEYRSTLPFSNPGMPKIKALHLWGILMKPFVTSSNDQFRPPAPYAINSIAYENDYNEVKTKGARVNHTRTADETVIGIFWVEKSAAGWNRFARNIIKTHKLDAWKTARLLALLNTAMADATSGCFESKYYYFYWRPETAIRLADNGNPNTISDATWLPSYTEIPNANPDLNAYTPPIPDYPSAHANFGGAAAEILTRFFGSDAISIDQTSPTLPGVTRHYNSISQAARDNSLSRIYVGYHFRNACLQGEEQGRRIAAYVFGHSFKEN